MVGRQRKRTKGAERTANTGEAGVSEQNLIPARPLRIRGPEGTQKGAQWTYSSTVPLLLVPISYLMSVRPLAWQDGILLPYVTDSSFSWDSIPANQSRRRNHETLDLDSGLNNLID